MAPKKKAYKNGGEDWEAEALGELPESSEISAQPIVDPDLSIEEGAGGGLLTTLRKSRRNKEKKGKPVDPTIVESEDPLEEDLSQAVQNGQPRPEEEGNADNLIGTPGPTVKGAKGPKGKTAKLEPSPQLNGNGVDEDVGGLKSKKEKEKERKEREKQRKKEQVGLSF